MIDHLVLAGPDLDAATVYGERVLGVASVAGGQHLGVGTRNRLIGLGGATYLEIIGPDPEQPDPDRPRPFGIDTLDEPRLMAWAVARSDIETARSAVGEELIGHGTALSRKTPEGNTLAWIVTPTVPGPYPFLIDWLDTVHPTTSLEHLAEFVKLRVETPDPKPVRAAIRALGLDVEVRPSPAFRIAATIDLSDRRVVLW